MSLCSRRQAALNMRDGSSLSSINHPTSQHHAYTDIINNDMTPLTLWSKDSGEDFKVLSAVHVDTLHVEELTPNRSCCALTALPLNKCSWLIHCSTGWSWKQNNATSSPQSQNQPGDKFNPQSSLKVGFYLALKYKMHQ